MSVAVTVICVVLSAIVCYFLGIGYVIEQYSREQEERANNRTDSKVG